MTGTPKYINFSFEASLSWPNSEQYEPTTFDETAAQDAIRGAREQGLPDRVSDPVAVHKLRSLLRRRSI